MTYSTLFRKSNHVIGTLLLCCSSMAANATSICAPGVNWVSSCTAGTETLSVSMVFGFNTDFDAFNTTDVEAQFDGTMTVVRSAPYSTGSGGPGYLDSIDTEIVSMNLTGASPYVAGWTLRAGVNEGLAATTGYISELGDPLYPDARYDMVFEFENTPFGTLHHNGTFFVLAQISQTPEIGAVYKHLGCCFGTLLDLYDDSNVNVLQLTDQLGSNHGNLGRPELTITGAVVPLPASLWLMFSGLIGLLGMAKRRNA